MKTNADTPGHVKVGERRLNSGIIVEYYCDPDGPSIQECMDRVAEIAADAIIRQGFRSHSKTARVLSSEKR